MFTALASGMFASFGFQIVAGRYLTPDQYGKLSMFVGILSVMAAPGLSFQLNSAAQPRVDCKSDEEIRRLFQRRMGYAFSAACGLLVAVGTATPFLRSSFGFSWISVIALAIYAFPVTWEPVFFGVLQAEQRFQTIALLSTLQTFGKLVAVVGAITAGFDHTGIALCMTVTAAFISAGGVYQARNSSIGAPRHLSRRGIRITQFMILFWMAATVDVYLARATLDGATAGQYAAGSTLAKLVLLFALTIAQVQFPDLLKSRHRKNRYGIGIGIAVAAVGLVIAMTMSTAVDVLFGHQYLAPSLWVIPITNIPLALSIKYVYHLIALDAEEVSVLWVTLILLVITAEIALAIAFSEEMITLLLINGAANAVFMVISALEYRRHQLASKF